MRRSKPTLALPLRTTLPGCALEARDQWVPQYTQSIPVESSSTRFPPFFAFPGPPSPTSGQTSSNHPKSAASIEMEGRLWNSTGGKSLGPLSCTRPLSSAAAHIRVDSMQLFTTQLFPSPCSDHCPNINARFAHDPSTPISTLSRGSHSVDFEQFRNAPWRRAQELEPKDPTTGRSVLFELLEERTSRNTEITCRLCNEVFIRWDRAITHIRHKHLDHRPYRCGGACGTEGWYENFICAILGPT